MQTRIPTRGLFAWRRAIASERGPASGLTRLVLLAMSLRMDASGGSCFPSIATLATDTALSERSVMRHIEQAIRQGWITKRKRRRQGRGWNSFEYFAVLDRGDTESPARAERSDSVAEKRDSLSQMGDTESHEVVREEVIEEESAWARLRAHTRKKSLAPHWRPSERVYRWAREKNYPAAKVKACLEAFTSHCRANGKEFADWDEALMTWIRREKDFTRMQSKATTEESRQPADTRCCWTNSGRARRCESEGTVHMGGGHFLCGPHAGELSKLNERRQASSSASKAAP